VIGLRRDGFHLPRVVRREDSAIVGAFTLLILITLVLLSAGCSYKPEKALLSAVARNDLQEVDRLLREEDVDVNARARLSGDSALSSAASLGEVEMARLLLARGANPNIGDKDNLSPLQLAAYHGNLAMVRMLLKAGANVNSADSRYGYTPLASASQNGHVEVVRELLKAGADPTLRIRNGMTAAELAHLKGKDDVERLLQTAAPSTQPAEK
jgi:ankyrin repeat protein